MPISTYSHALPYDAENRIIQVGSYIKYKYGGDGNRVTKIIDATLPTETSTIYFRNAATGTLHQEFINGGLGYALDQKHLFLAGRNPTVRG